MEVMGAMNRDCDLGLRIGRSGVSDGDPFVPIELDLLPLAPIPRHSAASEVFQCTKSSSEQGSRQDMIDVNQPPLQNSCSTSTQHDNAFSSSPHREGSYGVGIKREHGGLMEEGGCRVSEEEAESGGSRKKLKLSRDQSALLEESFRENSTLNTKQKQALAKRLNLRFRQVEVWFQNRRARTKLKQTEVDCEFLKKCYESLRQENRRLQKELAQLRSMKVAAATASPVYMQMPRAVVSMCPSCQRIANCDNIGPFTPLPNPHLYTSYTNSSLSC